MPIINNRKFTKKQRFQPYQIAVLHTVSSLKSTNYEIIARNNLNSKNVKL